MFGRKLPLIFVSALAVFTLAGCVSSDPYAPTERDAKFIVIDYKGEPLNCVVVGSGNEQTMSCDFVDYHSR